MKPKAPDRALAWSGAFLWFLAACALKRLQAHHLQNQAFDLGVYVNVLWNTAHGAWFRDGVKDVNYLADHFSPGLIFLVPLATKAAYAQCAALAASIPAVYELAKARNKEKLGPATMAAAFALSPLLLDGARYDVHAIAFAVPLLCWGLVCFEWGKAREAFLLLFLAGLFQEDAWLLCFAAAFWAGYRRSSFLFIASFAVSLLAMRHVAAGWTPAHWSFYSFSNWGPDTRAWGLVRLLLPLAGLPLFAGKDALPLLMPFLYTWLGDNPHQQSFDLHYGLALLPFAFLAASRRWKPAFLGLTLLWLPYAKRWYHVAPPGREEAAVELAALIPEGANVAASFNLVPPLAARPVARLWRGEDYAGYWIALDREPAGFAPNPARDQQVKDFAGARAERVVFDKAGLVLIKPADTVK